MIIYYAHSILSYDSRKERKELKQIRKKFRGCSIINPARIVYQSFSGAGIIQECLEYVRQADILVATEFKGYIGKGVFTEIAEASEKERYLLRDKQFIKDFTMRVINRDDWKVRYGKCEEAL